MNRFTFAPKKAIAHPNGLSRMLNAHYWNECLVEMNESKSAYFAPFKRSECKNDRTKFR